MKRIIALIVMFLLTFVYLSLSIAELPAKFPKMNSETYVFTSFEKRLKTMRILALPNRDKDVKDLKTSFEGTGIRIVVLPSEKIARALEVGMIDGAVCTFKELVFDLKRKFPEGIALSLYPEIALFDPKLQTSATYRRVGLSFKYPKGQEITEKGVPLYGEKPSKEAGSIWIKSDPKTNPVILVSWLPNKKRDYKLIAKLMGVSIKARKPNHDIHIEQKMRELKLGNHRLLLQRFCTQGREGILLNISTGWFCDQSKRIFKITVSAPWKKPTFVVHSVGNPVPDWPPVKSDPSFIAFQEIVNAFTCHGL